MKLLKKINIRIVVISLFFVFLTLLAFAGALLLANMGDITVLKPKGPVAADEKNLIVFATILSLVVVLPVFALTFWVVWKYRASNHRAHYRPEWDHSKLLESIWWGVPLILIIILSVVTFKSSHDLDPSKPLAAEDSQMKVQVVAMNWKWLFIYPEENIATVNYLRLPVDQPVEFQITGDSAMNSFWIPALGGQIYAMSGMSTKLHLQASEPGEYRGSSANISGRGFAGMNFAVKVSSASDYEKWVQEVKKTTRHLTFDEYDQMRKPTVNHPPTLFASAQEGLYNRVIRRYILP